MLMLATVVEARLMGVNPYAQPGAEVARRNLFAALKAMPDHTASHQGGPRRPQGGE
jgi:glucose-6-phosphate isomerase